MIARDGENGKMRPLNRMEILEGRLEDGVSVRLVSSEWRQRPHVRTSGCQVGVEDGKEGEQVGVSLGQAGDNVIWQIRDERARVGG